MADNRTDDLCRLATRPFAFIARYLRQRPLSHIAIVTAVLAAVGCSVTAASVAGRPGAIGPSYLGKTRKTAALMPVNLTTSQIGSKISEFKGQHRSPSGDEEICPDNWTVGDWPSPSDAAYRSLVSSVSALSPSPARLRGEGREMAL